VIGGYGHLEAELRALAGHLGIEDRVRFLGEVREPQAFYDMTDMFVMTSRWEGFPVVLLEAMAAGKAVVSTEVGGIAEMIDHGESGLLCPAGDVEQLASALCFLSDGPDRRARMGALARERVRARFAIQRLARDWDALYEEARTRGRGPVPVSDPRRGAEPLPLAADLPPQADRILVWRLCRFDRYVEVLERLRARYPGVAIDAVCQTDAQARVAVLHGGGRVVPYGIGRFTLWKLGWRNLTALRRRRYDLAILPYNGQGRAGYRHAELAAASVCPLAFGWHADGSLRRLPRQSLLTLAADAPPAALHGCVDLASAAWMLAQGVVAGWQRQRRALSLPGEPAWP
jgi:hypothetical protein